MRTLVIVAFVAMLVSGYEICVLIGTNPLPPAFLLSAVIWTTSAMVCVRFGDRLIRAK